MSDEYPKMLYRLAEDGDEETVTFGDAPFSYRVVADSDEEADAKGWADAATVTAATEPVAKPARKSAREGSTGA